MCNRLRLILTIKLSSLHDSVWFYFLLSLDAPQNTQSDKVSAVINYGWTEGFRPPHNELGKHQSSQNPKNRRVCLFVWRLHSDMDLNSAVSSVRWKQHQRPSLAIAWIPANNLFDIQTVTDGYKMKASLSCFSPKRMLIQPRPPYWCPLCVATYFGFLWPTVLPRLALSLGMTPKTKEPSSAWYGSPSALTLPET